MNPEAEALLALIAEVAIGTVALSGITMVLLVSGRHVAPAQRGLIAAQLSMAFVVVLAAIFPLLVNRYGLALRHTALYCPCGVDDSLPEFRLRCPDRTRSDQMNRERD